MIRRWVLVAFALAVDCLRAVGADPPLSAAPVYRAGEDGYHTYRIPSIIATGDALLAFAEGRKHSRSDSGDIDLLLKRSADAGHTWSPQQIVWDDGDNTCGNPCPVVDRTSGHIWLLMTHNAGGDTEKQILAGKSRGTRTVWITRSEDAGATWTDPRDITSQVKRPEWTWYATGPGIGIQLASGRLLIPCDHCLAGSQDKFAHVIYSDDCGRSWQIGGSVGPGGNECQAVERADGRLMLNIRSYRTEQRRLVAISEDGGQTFGPAYADDALEEPICQASILRLPGGEILFSNPAGRTRERLTVRLSRDDGRTWPAASVLHAGPAAYSCLVALPEGEVGCLFEAGEKNPYEAILLARIPATWLRAANP